MDQLRFRQLYQQRLANMGGNYLDGGNYLTNDTGGKLSKKGVKLRESKTVKKRKVDGVPHMSTKQTNPWLEYVALERNKKVNAKLTYRELLQNIDKDAYARWKKSHYPGSEPVKKSPAKKKAASPKKASPAKKAPAAKSPSPKKKAASKKA